MYEAKAYKGLKQGSPLVPAALGGNQGNPWVFITLVNMPKEAKTFHGGLGHHA